jgi:signal transduction histidine kinase
VPAAAVAYIVPLFGLSPSDRTEGLASAVVALPICALIGESLARSIDRAVATETELRRERADAERVRQIQRMRETFMRAASHELRTPITICRGHLEILEPTADYEELGRMQRLVDDITALSRLEDRGGLKRAAVDVENLVRSVAVKSEAVLGQAVDVRVDGTGHVYADRQRLEQALLGVIQNVHDHAGPGAKVIVAAAHERRAWRFDVMDDGVGLAPEIEEQLFQPFQHGPASGGSGLGLAIVRAIARAHGGEATAERRRPSGTIVSLRIPS